MNSAGSAVSPERERPARGTPARWLQRSPATLVGVEQRARQAELERAAADARAAEQRHRRRVLAGLAAALSESNKALTRARDEALQANAQLRQKSALVGLLQRVAVAANQAESLETALQIGIDEVCAYTGWPVGHAYIVAEDGCGELNPGGVWHLDDPERFATFRQITEVTRFRPGVGLPGRVLSTGKPLWIMDVTQDANFPRAKAATDIGVKGAFGFPLLVGSEVYGVLEFFSSEPKEPDEALLQTMAHIGTQLGRVFERRRRVEKELRRAKLATEQRNAELEQALSRLKKAQEQLIVQESSFSRL